MELNDALKRGFTPLGFTLFVTGYALTVKSNRSGA
jgi:hypothetical protein